MICIYPGICVEHVPGFIINIISIEFIFMLINSLYEDFDLSGMDEIDWTDTMADVDDDAVERAMIM